jgi:hypothetical protein
MNIPKNAHIFCAGTAAHCIIGNLHATVARSTPSKVKELPENEMVKAPMDTVVSVNE